LIEGRVRGGQTVPPHRAQRGSRSAARRGDHRRPRPGRRHPPGWSERVPAARRTRPSRPLRLRRRPGFITQRHPG